MNHPNPFESGTNPMTGEPTQYISAHDRIQAVRHFNYGQCLAALEVPGVQKSVANAARARMRQIVRDGGEQQ